jgi:hypothetical protein
MPQCRITWRLMFRVNDGRAAQRCIDRVRERLGGEWQVALCERYWKMPELWECCLEGAELDRSVAEMVLHCLLLANRLGVGWRVLGPSCADRIDGFSGVLAINASGAPSVPGLEWASFDLISADSGARESTGNEP